MKRPNPANPAAWCGVGDPHDHRGCGDLWNSADAADWNAAQRAVDAGEYLVVPPGSPAPAATVPAPVDGAGTARAADPAYNRRHPADAVRQAWAEPGIDRRMHNTTRREVGRLSPQLARALIALERAGDEQNRSEVAGLATVSVSGTLARLYPDGDSDDERWRKATVVVNALVKAGLI